MRPLTIMLLSVLCAPPVAAQPRVVLAEAAVGRSSPPSGPLNAVVGPRVQTLQQGAEVQVLSRRTYGGFNGAHVWLEVLPPRSGASAPKPVWIYGGTLPVGAVVPSGVTTAR